MWYLNVPGQAPVTWGNRGDVPMPGDYDGDGRANLCVYRPATGQWFIAYAASGFTTNSTVTWGVPGDIREVPRLPVGVDHPRGCVDGVHFLRALAAVGGNRPLPSAW